MTLKYTKQALVYAALIVIAFVMILPLLIALFTSLKSDAELNAGVVTLLPQQWNVSNYYTAMTMVNWPLYFKNSLIVTLIAVFGSIFFNSLAGYTFARLAFKGRDVIFVCLLIGMMVPAQVTVIPQFLILKAMPLFGGNDWFGNGGTGWLDTYYALIVPELSGSFGIFLARQFYLSFPKALDDAANIDGAGMFKTFVRIYLPLSGPLIASMGILKTVSVWNDFFHPLIYTNSETMRTVQLGLQAFNGEAQIKFNLLMAATLVVSLPLMAMFFLFQKYFVQSLISSSVKG
ncbi:L-arabinose transport system permease protein AraQ [Paenibacillus sp. CECT 9249]|uniref:carbohydrate ABC transporter permease n=1 Tax=Paenibacillus sp. CECT 9249 TaxID=2845385 RepID=UPI001E4914ED|nr:carbohydrate ABC transporter permease [Paenibacillus sp. CECT 9249]CAH0121284.1 L-arabinose transport system permease protein AraQ [Paenibacillus sp. CECT 9249]